MYSTFVERMVATTGVNRRTLYNIRKELRHNNRKNIFQPDSNPCSHESQPNTLTTKLLSHIYVKTR